jgi:hypothetical protein
MKISSLIATPVAFFLPSRSTSVTTGKLALIGMLVTTFFLFTAGYRFPGGSIIFTDWAEAIVHHTTLPPTAAVYDVGFPLLYILGGFPYFHSFIGITLIYALFAILMPVLVYWSLVRTSPTVAFYVGMLCILSLSPYTYMKFLFHDQAYMFFTLLTVALLIEFLWTGRFRILYLFTLVALAASFTRTAGNLIYPMLLTIAYITVRGRLRHYLGCLLVFALATGAYEWHRYEIFDMRHQTSIPSGKGMQISYAAYLYMGDFGVRLSPDMGPNIKLALEKLREGLQPSTRESQLIKTALPEEPSEFLEKHVYAYTPDELFKLICTEPNEEYYWILFYAYDPDDEFHFKLAMEIWRSHPWYVAEYTMRNLWHAVVDPGYGKTRYGTQGYGWIGDTFMPALRGWGAISEDSAKGYGARADRELEYFPLKAAPLAVQRIFADVRRLWLEYYRAYVYTTAVPILIAWIANLLGAVCWLFPRTGFCRVLISAHIDKLVGPIVAVSALLLYEDLATAMFSQPYYRYFHITEPWRLVIAGLGVAILQGTLSTIWPRKIAAIGVDSTLLQHGGFVSAILNHDLLDGYFGRRPGQWIVLLIFVNASLFAWWTSAMIALPSEEAIKMMENRSDAQRLSDMSNLQKALNDYFEDNDRYPATPAAVDCPSGHNNVGNLSGALVPQYIAAIPKDPNPLSCEYNYEYWSDAKNYYIMVHLDNIDPGTYKDRWCVGATGGSNTVSPASHSLRCPGSEPIKAAAPSTKSPPAVPPTSGLNIRSATYGGNCGAGPGNATKVLARACNGRTDCDYKVDVGRLGDPAHGCGKDFVASYSCAPDTTPLEKALPAEAGRGSILNLTCASAGSEPKEQ